MYTLKAEIRDMSIKAKRLRKEGKIPATIYGKNLEEPIMLEINKADVASFTSKISKGSTLTIDAGGKSYDVMFKEISRNPVLHSDVLNIEFQSLIAGEAMNTVTKVVLQNTGKNKNIVTVHIDEIPYSAEAKDFVNEIVIDADGLEDGTTINLGDLDIAKNDKIKLGLPEDTLVVSVAAPVIKTEEEDEGETAEQPTEPEVIGEENTEE